MTRNIFRATEISGLIDPTYYSGAANKGYVDKTFAPSGDISWAYLSSLADVEIISPGVGSGLRWDGTHWIPSSVAAGGASSTLEDLTDTNVPAPTSGNSLTYDGTYWIDRNVQGSPNLDGGLSDSTYGGISGIDCGGS